MSDYFGVLEKALLDYHAHIPGVVDRWRNTLLACQEVADTTQDETTALAIQELHRAYNLPVPRRFLFCDSPVAANIVAASGNVRNGELHKEYLYLSRNSPTAPKQGTSTVGNTTGLQEEIEGITGSRLVSAIRQQATNRLARTKNGIEDCIERQATGRPDSYDTDPFKPTIKCRILSPVGSLEYVQSPLDSERPHQWWLPMGGSLDSNWLMGYDFVLSVVGLRLKELTTIDTWTTLASNCGLWAVDPDTMTAVIAARPTTIHLDNLGRPHGENGPAIRFRDGAKVYAWHGRTITEENIPIIENPSSLSAGHILKEPNAETRRVMIERMGFAAFLSDLKAKPVQEDKWGRLYRVQFPDNRHVCLVEVENHTPDPDGQRRRFILGVPQDTRTAAEGVAATFRKRPEDFDPAYRA